MQGGGKFGTGLVTTVAILSLALGIWIGSNQGGHTPSEVSPQKTVTVTVTKPVITPSPAPYVPTSCTEAAQLLEKMYPLLGSLMTEPNTQADIITQVKSGILSKDTNLLSSAATKENTEHNSMADISQQLLDSWSMYQQDQAQCLKEVGK